MKILKPLTFLFLLICTSTSTSFAQDTLVSYFDEDWEEVAKKDAEFKRKGFKIESGWGVIDSYLSNGVVQMTGSFKSSKAKIKIGVFEYYFENGQLKDKGNYKKGKREGEWNWYYENGQKMLNVPFYHKGKSTSLETRWREDGSLDYKCVYKKDKLNGESKWYHKNGKVSSVEVHKKGKLVSYEHLTESGKKVDNPIYFKRARFPGGNAGIQKYIVSEVGYPALALENDISGSVQLYFVINKVGKVIDVKVIKSVHSSLDKEAIRVIKKMPRWTPAVQHNRKLNMSFRLPVKFEIY
jgi:TonB family protein